MAGKQVKVKSKTAPGRPNRKMVVEYRNGLKLSKRMVPIDG